MQSVRVGNLDYRVTEEDIRHLFSRFGAVVNIQLFSNRIVDRFAVIQFVDKESVEKAKELDGLKIWDCYITVER